MVKKICFFSIFVIFSLSFAQNLSNVEVGKKSIFLRETLEVKVNRSGKSDEKVSILSRDFLVVSQSTSSQIMISNGEIKKESHYIFYLKAKFPGKKVFSVKIGDEIQGPFPIEVKQGDHNAQTSSKDFAEFVLEKKSIYVNEPAELKIVSFTQEPVVKAAVKRETLSHRGLYLEPLPIENKEKTKVVIDNVSLYQETIARFAVYPLYPGKHNISAANVVLLVGKNNFFGLQTKRIELALDSLTITAQPMPQKNKPKDFLNNYGDYDLSIKWQNPQVVLGNPATLEITAKGKGNLPILNFPRLNLPNAQQIGDVSMEKNYFFNGDHFEGTVTAKYFLLYYQAGEYHIPPLAFHSFDKKRGYFSKNLIAGKIKIVPNNADQTALAFTTSISQSNSDAPNTEWNLADNQAKMSSPLLDFLENNFFYCHKIALLLAFMGPLYAFVNRRNKRDKKKRAKKLALQQCNTVKKKALPLDFSVPQKTAKRLKKQIICDLQKILRQFLYNAYGLDIAKNGLEVCKKHWEQETKMHKKNRLHLQKCYEILKKYEHFLLANQKKDLNPKQELESLPWVIKNNLKKLEQHAL